MIRRTIAAFILIAGLVSSLTGADRAATPAERQSARVLRDEASRAMDEGRFEDAVAQYSRLRERLPEVAQIPYNMAVAQYRQGNLDQAAELFNESIGLAEQADLRNRATYNLGNTAYAQSLQALQGQGDPEQAMAGVDQATGRLKEALKNFKQTLSADPTDDDARVNAELAHRLLKQLEQLQQQMQQQNPQQQDQQQDQENQQQQPENSEGQEQQEQQQAGEQQEQQQEQQQPQSAQEEGQEQQQQAEPDEESGGGEPQERRQMTREEAERLLQKVRDKERQRREELVRRQRGRYKPAEKDW